ncbi:GNAT family N-acetyltransferase [Mammaliicoccus sciuri]|uniref:GNAT family N-acetyltransferase n=1 Tax=Mammaliicoccus sciuri TaxID=1296 RepID=UPI000E69AF91|nr:GNAT family N-acetyltransferase [Mammaliicoccus sciuri]RIO17452.1 GNAT family N-acetyltransferase [Mammaliicoccus sciuri]
MEVRLLNKNDVNAFRSLRLLSLQTDPSAFASLYDIEINYPISKFEQRLECSDTKFTMGGFEDENLVAMYCHPDYRGTGIAEKVVDKLIIEASKLTGLKYIDLSVLSNNQRAVEFYNKVGFDKYATEPNAILDGKDYHDEDMMRYEIE